MFALTLSACAAPSAPPSAPPIAPSTEQVRAPSPPPFQPPAGAHTIESNGGRWRIVYLTQPDPPERGATFAVDAWVCDAARPDQPREDVALVVDAAMPQHQHGMNRMATMARDGAEFRAQGLLFHMAGRWELYFDVTEGAVTERAQVEIDVE